MAKIDFHIPNISCSHCLHTIKTELEELSGVIKVEGNVDEKSVSVTYQNPATEEMITKVLQEIDYPPQ